MLCMILHKISFLDRAQIKYWTAEVFLEECETPNNAYLIYSVRNCKQGRQFVEKRE